MVMSLSLLHIHLKHYWQPKLPNANISPSVTSAAVMKVTPNIWTTPSTINIPSHWNLKLISTNISYFSILISHIFPSSVLSTKSKLPKSFPAIHNISKSFPAATPTSNWIPKAIPKAYGVNTVPNAFPPP